MKTGRKSDCNSDLNNTHKFAESVIFAVGHRTLRKAAIKGISLLHYLERGPGDAPCARSGLDYAEILIYYDEGNGGPSTDITRSELRRKFFALNHEPLPRHFRGIPDDRAVRRNTVVRTEEGVNVVVQAVECFGFIGEEQRSRINSAEVTFCMTTAESKYLSYLTRSKRGLLDD